jgi:hypothetical protein
MNTLKGTQIILFFKKPGKENKNFRYTGWEPTYCLNSQKDIEMQNNEPFAPDPVNAIVNQELRAAIRAMLYSENKRNLDGFLRVFLESDLIVLTLEAPISQNNDILHMDEEGFGYYGKGTQIPLVQLQDDSGKMILPVFTESLQVHTIEGLNEFHGLAVSAPLLLEMCVMAGSDFFCINPGSKEEFTIERISVIEIVTQLRINKILPETPSTEKREATIS